MRVLIVHTHPEPTSFNAGLTATAVHALEAAGEEVVVSDLYAQGFDPVSDRRNFVSVKDSERFSQQVEESHASRGGGYDPIHHGILGFVGFSVVEPFVIFGPRRMSPSERSAVLERYAERRLNIERTPLLSAHGEGAES